MKKKTQSKQISEDFERTLSHRAGTLELRSENGAEQLHMSVSSEEPVLSYVYFNDRYQQAYEILDHSASSINLSRAADGLVILDRHGGDQVGLMSVEIRDGKLGGLVEFCTGQRAQEIKADAAKGLRRNVSVGYMIDSASYVVEGSRDGVPVVRAKSWTPYEASFEPVPADSTVGVGRAHDLSSLTSADDEVKKHETRKKVMDKNEMAKLFARAAQYGIEAAKVSALIEADETSARAKLDEMIVDKQSADLEKERATVAELRTKKPAAPEVEAVAPLGGSREEEKKIMRRYSVMNVVRALAGVKSDIGFEREISEELAKQRGKAAEGIIIPHAALAQRDLTVSGSSSATVATDLMVNDFIDLLQTKAVLGQAGVTFMPGLVGNIAIPKMTAGASGYWVSEGGAITESQPTLGQVAGSPNTCGVMVDISRRLLLQSTPAAETLVRNEIVNRIIRTIQIAVFAGTGADGQPSAITNATGINNPSVTQGTPTYAEILNFPGSIMADSAEADGQKFLMTAEVWAKLAATLVGADGARTVLDPFTKKCIGYDYFTTEDLPANSLWFGDWKTVVIGMWGNGIDINADTATLSSSGGLRLVGLQDVDVMVRQGYALAYNTAVTS